VNPIRDLQVQKIEKLLDAFAIIENVSDMAAQAVKGSIMTAIGSIAAEADVFDAQNIAPDTRNVAERPAPDNPPDGKRHTS
jgi:hypothetical protein